MSNRRDGTRNHATEHASPERRHKVTCLIKQQHDLIPGPAPEDSEFRKNALGLLKQLEVAEGIHSASAAIINKAQARIWMPIGRLQQEVADDQRREMMCFWCNEY
ncbi:hypothetical protein KR99_24380 [Ralstonia solanacearum]|nr:hypothetical protein KR99_24380 [Ralstonia solanacearum]